MTTIVVVVAVLIGLTALTACSWLHLEGDVDDDVARVGLRWGVLATAVDVRARELVVRLFGLGLIRHPFRSGSRRADVERPQRRLRSRSARSALARVLEAPHASRFYRRQLGYLFARVRVDRLRAQLRLATPDPALTGFLYGVGCAAAAPLAARWPAVELVLEPDFLSELPGGRGTMALRVRVATLAVVAWHVLRHERSQMRGRSARATEEGRSADGTT